MNHQLLLPFTLLQLAHISAGQSNHFIKADYGRLDVQEKQGEGAEFTIQLQNLNK